MLDPAWAAVGGAAVATVAECGELSLSLDLVDVLNPIFGHANRPIGEERQVICRFVGADPETAPGPLFGPLDQPGAQGVALDVAEHAVEVLLRFDGK